MIRAPINDMEVLRFEKPFSFKLKNELTPIGALPREEWDTATGPAFGVFEYWWSVRVHKINLPNKFWSWDSISRNEFLFRNYWDAYRHALKLTDTNQELIT